MSAQRYPGDFDGIIGGALANRHIHMHTAAVTTAIHLSRNPDQAISEAKAKMVNKAVMDKCDTLKEGFLNNPRKCAFDFSTLLCKGKDSDTCITEAQLRTVEEFYGGVKKQQRRTHLRRAIPGQRAARNAEHKCRTECFRVGQRAHTWIAECGL